MDLGADGLVTAVPRRFEPMATSDQLITCATPPDDDRFQQASRRNGFDEPVDDQLRSLLTTRLLRAIS